MDKKSLNDEAWDKLFEKYDILNQIQKEGEFVISADEINEIREARLMTKFDHQVNLPQIFNKEALSILPISRGKYIISQFNAYSNLQKITSQIQPINRPNFIESIDFRNINSEATAINAAYISGIYMDFLEAEELYPTVNGRMGSSVFNFNIENTKKNNLMRIDVSNSQVEIDGGFECVNSLALIEAKNDLSTDLLIRQIYYPYRLWRNKLQEKSVRNIFQVYSNGIFYLYEFVFDEINNYNSIRLIRSKRYSLEENEISLDDIIEIRQETRIITEPQVPFPQANSFERVINLCELLNEETELSREDITIKYAFNIRQTNYYTDILRYLGLGDKKIENSEIKYFLTPLGKSLFDLSFNKRQLKYVELILQHKVFNDVLEDYLKEQRPVEIDRIVTIMKDCALYNIGKESTYERRASTIKRWIDWILDLPQI